jgi:hypothetical protein
MLTIGKSTMLGAAFLAGVAIAACQQPPGTQIAALPPANGPPANAAPAPDRATPQQNPSRPIPQQPSIGRDGSYAGSMTEVASGLGGHTTTACVSRTPVSMSIERDDVTISYSDWNGRTIQYRGKVDPTGKIKARDTNDDGSGSILRGQIGNNGFTGNLKRNYCHYALTMPAEAVAADSPVR